MAQSRKARVRRNYRPTKKVFCYGKCAHQNPDVQHYMGGLVGQDMERNNGAGRVTDVPFMGSEMKMKGEKPAL